MLVLGGLIAIAYYGMEIVHRFRPKEATRTALDGQPIEVREAHRFATRDEHLELKSRVYEITEKIEEGFRQVDQKRSVSIANLHELIREQGMTVAALRAETSKQTEDLGDLKRSIGDAHARIDSVPARTIQLLRDTKGLI